MTIYLNLSAKYNGHLVYVMGVDFGPRVLLLVELGDYQIWKAPGHTVWAGIACPRSYIGTSYLLVQVHDWQAYETRVSVLKRIEPGFLWRDAVPKLIAEARDLSAQDQKERSHLRRAS